MSKAKKSVRITTAPCNAPGTSNLVCRGICSLKWDNLKFQSNIVKHRKNQRPKSDIQGTISRFGYLCMLISIDALQNIATKAYLDKHHTYLTDINRHDSLLALVRLQWKADEMILFSACHILGTNCHF